jgi:hypothetical protein
MGKGSIMPAKGIYRTKTPESGAEYAFVDYGIASTLNEIPRWQYENADYEPPFDSLPTKGEYEARIARPKAPKRDDS